MANHRNTEEKFWSFVRPNVMTGCREWTGTLWSTGYGRFIFNGKDDRAHRIAWLLEGNRLSPDACLLHHCDNRKCCNPDHLFIGTRAENNLDKTRKGRQSKGEECHSAKLNIYDVLNIRKSSQSISWLADRYKLTRGHIRKIRALEKWKHV